MTYDCNGFCEKNRDVLFKDCIELMQASQKLVNTIMSNSQLGSFIIVSLFALYFLMTSVLIRKLDLALLAAKSRSFLLSQFFQLFVCLCLSLFLFVSVFVSIFSPVLALFHSVYVCMHVLSV